MMKQTLPTNPQIRSYRDLVVWQKAFSLGLAIYLFSKELPIEERFGLASQLRRGAISIASNIAEGYGRGSRIDYLRFLKIACGAIYELDTQLLFACKLEYLEMNNYNNLKSQLDECERILAGLIRSLKPIKATS